MASGLYKNVIQQFNQAADTVGLDENIRRILERTTNEVVVNFPVKLDDGRIKMFTGYRVQHNNVQGPYKGGGCGFIPVSISTKSAPWRPG